MNNRRGGLTIIEAVLALVILCILSSLIALTASGVQANKRNADRQSEIDTIKKQLEGYYAKTDRYPALADLNNSEWRSQNMPHLKTNAVQDPRWSIEVAECTANDKATLSDKPAANCYSYQVTAPDGSPCDNNSAVCAHYALTATLEGGEAYVKNSLN